MSDTTRDKARADLKDIDSLSRNTLPDPADGGDVVSLDQADPAQRDKITRRMAEIDVTDTQSIISFGAAAQSELQEISQSMLSGVRNKDVGPAVDHFLRRRGSVRIAGNLAKHAVRRAQQGCGARRRFLARYRQHDPRLFGVRA
jgi:uncharacterized protein YaaN involved in tellurite resistance